MLRRPTTTTELGRTARRWRLGAWAVLALGMTTTGVVAWQQHQVVESERRASLDAEVDRATERLQAELEGHDRNLGALVAAIGLAGEVDQERFEVLVSSATSGTEQGVTAIERVGTAELDAFLAAARADLPSFTIRPPGDRSERWVVRLVAPLTGNLAALGTDLRTVEVPRQNLERSRDLGATSMTPPLRLVQGPDEPAVVLHRPVYRGGSVPEDLVSRRRELTGWVSVPLVGSRLVSGALGRHSPLTVRIDDLGGDGDDPPAVVSGWSPSAPADGAQALRRISVLGRSWQLSFAPTRPGGDSWSGTWLVLVPGAALTVLVVALLLQMGSSRERALRLSEEATAHLRHSEHRFRTLFRSAPVGYLLADARGRVGAVNPALCRLVGRSEEELLELSVDDLVHPEDRPALRLASAGAAARPWSPVTVEARVRRPTGELRWARVTLSGEVGEEARAGVVIANLEDVSDARRERERAEELAELARRLRPLQSVAELGAATVEAVGGLLMADRASLWVERPNGWAAPVAEWVDEATERLGVGRERHVPERLQRLIAAVSSGEAFVCPDVATDARLDDEARAFLAEALGVSALVITPVRAGQELVAALAVSVAGGPRPWDDGEVRLLDALAAELGVALRNAQLFERERQMVERLNELDRAKNDFVSSVSHELRTPLTSIAGYAELLVEGEAGPLTDEQHRMVSAVERNSERLLRLIEDLLVLSRVESGTFRLSFQTLDVAELVAEALDTMRPTLALRDLAVSVEVGAADTWVRGDPDHLQRVLTNLLGNAVKITPDGGRVEVAVGDRADGLVITITDTGMGIPVEEQGRLFTRFFRSDEARLRQIQGTGLGLVIARQIVEGHGGHIELASTPGVGTAVSVVLPRRPVTPIVVEEDLARG